MRGDVYIEVACDTCDEVLEAPLTLLAQDTWSDIEVEDFLRREMWVNLNGKDYCCYCAPDPEDD